MIGRAVDPDHAAGEETDPPLGLDSLLPGQDPARGREERLAQAPGYLADTRRMQTEGHPFAGRVHGRVIRDGDRGAWLQYWLFYYYNPKNLRGVGKHEGDWEMVQVHLGSDGHPDRATYAQHEYGEAREWDRVERINGHPIVYVGHLSHRSYFERGTYPYAMLRPYLPFGIDHGLGGTEVGQPPGPEEIAKVDVLPEDRWPEWPGRWGSGGRVLQFFGRHGDGPSSPGHQEPKWSDPEGFHRSPRWRVVLRAAGRIAHWLGELTFPRPPSLDSAEWSGDLLSVRYALQSTWLRHTTQVLITVNAAGGPQLVLASRVIPKQDASGEAAFRLPRHVGQPLRVWATAFNGPRQRSALTSLEVI